MFITVQNKISPRGKEVSQTTVKFDSKVYSIGEIPFTDKELIYLIKGLYEQRPDLFEELGLGEVESIQEELYDTYRRLENARATLRDELEDTTYTQCSFWDDCDCEDCECCNEYDDDME
jgi:hypothetical protein